MELKLEQIQPGDLDDVVAFLRKSFQAPPDAPFLQTDYVRWKFSEPRPDWDGSRSYVFREQSQIVAHACVVPATFMTPDGVAVRSIFPIDWAASPSVPGAGILLLKDLASLADIRLGYGGSSVTRAIVRTGHAAKKHPYEKIIGETIRARRSFRPWSALRHSPKPSWRTLAHVARDLWRNALRPLRVGGEWGARPVDRFEIQLPELCRRGNAAGFTLPVRTPELLNYMLRCPSVPFSGHLLEKDSLLRGHLLLGNLGEELRVADLVIDSDDVEDWAACYRLAVSTARRYYPQGGYLTVMAAPASLQSALFREGFTEEARHSVIVQDRGSLLPPERLPVLNMMDSDAAHLF